MTTNDYDNINHAVSHYLKSLSTSTLNDAMVLIRVYVEYDVNRRKVSTDLKDDIIQDAWLRVLEVLKTYIPDERPFTALMKVVVKNAITTALNKETAYKKRIAKVKPPKPDAVNLIDKHMKIAPIKHIDVKEHLKEQKKLNRRKK